MSKITGNEPAHPTIIGDMREPGLTIRQHYAGLAMQALISNPNAELTKFDKVIQLSVTFADLLITELNKP